jgi:hypothetical protein
LDVEKFPALHVVVRDGKVWKGLSKGSEHLLGSLYGAHANITEGTITTPARRRSGHARAVDAVFATAIAGPVGGVIAGAYSRPGSPKTRKTYKKHITFPDAPTYIGTVIWGNKARVEAERFNLLAGTSPDAGPPRWPGS